MRTPDRVLRERRQRLAEATSEHTAAAVVDPPKGSNPSPAAETRASEVPVGPEIASPTGDPSTAWHLPSWLQPFERSPDVRFTRTPESVLRRRALRHPRLGSAKAGPAAAPVSGSEISIDASRHAEPASRPPASVDAAALDVAQTIARSVSLPQIRPPRRADAAVPGDGLVSAREEQDNLAGDRPPA